MVSSNGSNGNGNAYDSPVTKNVCRRKSGASTSQRVAERFSPLGGDKQSASAGWLNCLDSARCFNPHHGLRLNAVYRRYAVAVRGQREQSQTTRLERIAMPVTGIISVLREMSARKPGSNVDHYFLCISSF